MNFTLITPSHAETSITGLIGGIEKEFRGRLFRIEFHRAGIRCFKNGIAWEWGRLPSPVQKAAHAGLEMIKQGQQLAKMAQDLQIGRFDPA